MDLIEIYEDVKNEKVNSPSERWGKLGIFFEVCQKTFTKMFVNRGLDDNPPNLEELFSSTLRKSPNWNSIKKSNDNQDIFLLGYFYLARTLYESVSQELECEKRDILLIQLLESHTRLGDIIVAIGASGHIKHSDLAKSLEVTPSALSNLMSRVKSYNIFETAIQGRNHYYSLSYPIGKRLLSLMNTRSARQKSIEDLLSHCFLLMNRVYMGSLSPDIAWNECSTLLSSPLGKISDMEIVRDSFLKFTQDLQLQRVKLYFLRERERAAKRKVVIYTTDISSESCVRDRTVAAKIGRHISYNYYVRESENVKSEEDAKRILISNLQKSSAGRGINYYSRFSGKKRISINIVSSGAWDESVFTVGRYERSLSELSEIVIYDDKEAYISDCDRINLDTWYLGGDRLLWSPDKQSRFIVLSRSVGVENPLDEG